MLWIRIAAVVGFLAVAFGAFGAHALRDRVAPNLLSAYQTGVLYHLVHAAALFALALYARATSASITWPAVLWLAGVTLFSGSLYAMALTGATKLGAITPFGGLCLLGGWAALLFLVR
jgi:uncharacterized membrane protein YgdD (TMEM256/DUF423 family)